MLVKGITDSVGILHALALGDTVTNQNAFVYTVRKPFDL